MIFCLNSAPCSVHVCCPSYSGSTLHFFSACVCVCVCVCCFADLPQIIGELYRILFPDIVTVSF
jgi:hypothetical protein